MAKESLYSGSAHARLAPTTTGAPIKSDAWNAATHLDHPAYDGGLPSWCLGIKRLGRSTSSSGGAGGGAGGGIINLLPPKDLAQELCGILVLYNACNSSAGYGQGCGK
jgi:hypothetical protein